MGTKRRISKKQLKQDKFIQTTFEFTDWVRDNQRTVTFSALAVILILVAGYAYSGYRRHREEAAQTSLYRAMQSYRSGNYALAASDLEKILSDASGSSEDDQILYYLGDTYYKMGDYERAETTLERFREKFGKGSPVSLQALESLSCTQEQKGELEKAAETSLQAAAVSRFPYQEKNNRMNAARLFKDLGEYSKALEQYDILLKEKPDEQINPVEMDEVRMLRAEVSALARSGDTQE